MNEQTPDQAVAAKAFGYGISTATKNIASAETATPDEVREANQTKADYLRVEIPGNANPYVVWADPSIEFQCPTCGDTITADREHPLHPEDKKLLEQYPATVRAS